MSQTEKIQLPASLQEAIDAFFDHEGDANECESTLFDIMQLALEPIAQPINDARPYDITSMYKSLRTLLTELYKHTSLAQASTVIPSVVLTGSVVREGNPSAGIWGPFYGADVTRPSTSETDEP